MRDDDTNDLPGWLGLRKVLDLTKARWLGPALSTVGALIVGGLFVLALASAFKLLSTAVFGSLLDDPRSALGVGGVTVALIGAPFVIWRSVVAQKTVNVTEQGHITDRINTAVQGLGAEKTVKRDGEEYSRPNLEVRIGAIYALERIAQDSDRDHVQIMEILCAYIRQNAPAPADDDWPKLEIKDSEDEGPLEADWEERLETFRQAQEADKAKLKLRDDIQTALTVIGRRSAKQRRLEAGRGVEAAFPFDTPCPEYNGPGWDHYQAALTAYREERTALKRNIDSYHGYRLDLRNADLSGADLVGANLNGAKLKRTFLKGADLRRVRLQGAELGQARLQGADLRQGRFWGTDLSLARLQRSLLWEANLQNVDLRGAWLQGASLDDALMQFANLMTTKLQGARLTRTQMQVSLFSETRLQGSDLRGSNLQCAMLEGVYFDTLTNIVTADLGRASVKEIDLTEIQQIKPHLLEMFGDASVTMPGGHGPGRKDWPPHWPKFGMDWPDFLEEWHKWQADPATYRPPKRPLPKETT